MIKWAQFPFLRITLAFIAGILLALQIGGTGNFAAYYFLAAICALALFFMVARNLRSGFAFSITGIIGLVCCGLAGFTLTQIRTASNDPQNLIHEKREITHYVGSINDFLLDKPTIFQTTLKLEQVKVNGKWVPAKGNIQLSIKKNVGLVKPDYGDVLLIKGTPKLVSDPLNPGQFNYRKYLTAQQIYHQQFLQTSQFEIIGQQISNPVIALSIQLRQNLDKILRKYIEGQREYGIASALVLGIKDQLDNDIKLAYANTGTMHVLAVSGLHVGLVFSLLSLALKRLNPSKANRFISAAIVLTVVWGYAFITALSASVLRAAVMFTVIVVASVLVRKTNMYNTLAVAAFILLCYNPYFLLDVGFQLSFVAVIAIVYLHPRLYQLYQPETRVGRSLWAMTCVSIAAQIGTLPFSLYYFHQFPVYFLLSNLIAVPLSTSILYNGFAVLLLGWIPGFGAVLGKLMEWQLYGMNEAMIWLEKLPLALINRIPFNAFQAVVLTLLILIGLLFLARPRFKTFAVAACLFLVFSISQAREKLTGSGQKKMIVFGVPKQSVIGFFGVAETHILADSAFLENKQAINFNLEPVFLNQQSAAIQFHSWETIEKGTLLIKKSEGINLIAWHGLTIGTLEKPLNLSLKNPVNLDVLILQKNVWISPEKLHASFKPKLIVFDSSNAGWYVKWLGKKLKAAGINYYDVSSKGAYNLTL